MHQPHVVRRFKASCCRGVGIDPSDVPELKLGFVQVELGTAAAAGGEDGIARLEDGAAELPWCGRG